MKIFWGALSIILLALPLRAQDAPVVVELFTSQGCASCPPADEMMGMLADRPDVIALSLHVDYWDYIGWKDEFALPSHAERQRAYAAKAGRRSVYTPEMIVNGQSDIVGARPMELAMAIEDHKAAHKGASVKLSRAPSGHLQVRVDALRPDLEAMDVLLLHYQPTRISRITRGENAGRTMEHVNVVLQWESLGRWDGQSPFAATRDLTGDLPVVVLVQAVGHGPIHGAAELAAAAR